MAVLFQDDGYESKIAGVQGYVEYRGDSGITGTSFIRWEGGGSGREGGGGGIGGRRYSLGCGPGSCGSMNRSGRCTDQNCLPPNPDCTAIPCTDPACYPRPTQGPFYGSIPRRSRSYQPCHCQPVCPPPQQPQRFGGYYCGEDPDTCLPDTIPGVPKGPARWRRAQDPSSDDINPDPCQCDQPLPNGHYKLKQEEGGLYPPDVTQSNKQEVIFYPKSTTSASASTNSNASGCLSLMGGVRPKQRCLVLAALVLAAAAGLSVPIALKIQAGASLDERIEVARRLLQQVPLIDGHNDLPWNIRKFVHNRLNELRFGEDLRQVPPWSLSAWSHTDLQRLRSGLVSTQFWAAYVPCESQFKDAVQLTLEQIDVIKRLTDKYKPPLVFCTSSEEILDAHKNNQLCSMIGVEGGHSLSNSLPVLRTLYSLGVRYLTLTSTCNTQWADSSLVDIAGMKPEHGGLTNFGKTIVKEMNRLGMLVDLSHVSVKTMKAALEVSKAPVLFSHSSARALCNSTRNVPDQILAKLGLNGGLVMVNFYSQFLTCKQTSTIADAVAHINHIRQIAGVDSVGLGAGYDGINFTPKGLEDVSTYPRLFAELIATGQWSLEDLKKLAGLNLIRVLKAVEKVRDEMVRSGVEPYEDTIAPKYLKGRSNCTSQEPF